MRFCRGKRQWMCLFGGLPALMASLALLALPVSCPAAGQPIVWKTPTLQFTLASPEAGMGLVGIRQAPDGVEFLKLPVKSEAAALWKIELTDNYRDEKSLITLDNTRKIGTCSVGANGRELTLQWPNVPLPDKGGVLNVTVRAEIDAGSGFSNWKIDVDNRSNRYGIWRVIFPVMELGMIGNSGDDDYLICSPAEGRSVRNPIGLDALPRQDRIDTGLDTTNTPTVIKANLSAEFGFGAAQPNGLPYPSARGQMQLSAYYQKPGDFYFSSATKGPGLYFTPHDGGANPKLFFYTPDAKRGVLTYEMANFPTDSAKPGLDYKMPYPMVIGGFSGDWYDAAQLYRRWALEQPWAAAGPLVSRKDVPDWLRQAVGVYRLDARTLPNENVLPGMDEGAKRLPGVWLAQWYDWAVPEKGPQATGYAFPPVAEGPPGFAALVEHLQAQHQYVTPYLNTRVWDQAAAGYAQVEKQLIQRPDGTKKLNRFKVAGGKAPDRVVGRVCLQTTFWQDYVARVAAETTKRYRPKGLYLDQAGGTEFGGNYEDSGCYDPSHGHPLGVTQDLVRAEHERMRQLLDDARKVDPQIVLTGEGVSEPFIDVMASKLIHYEIWPGYVPLFSAVYHDYTTAYGRTVLLTGAGGATDADPMPAMQIGWELICGNQIGRVWNTTLKHKVMESEIGKRHFDYLTRAATLREKWPQFLNLGSMQRPPRLLSEVPTVTTHQFRGKGESSLPGLLAANWRSPEGRVVTVVTNITNQPLKAQIALDVAELKVKNTAQWVYPQAEPAKTERRGGETVVHLELQPLNVRLLLWDR